MQRPRTQGNNDALEIAQRLETVRDRIARAAERAGRSPDAVTLIAVSKTVPPPRVYAAYLGGVRDFGENRVEEALPKQPALPDDAVWHMIGHIQSRKARDVVGHFALTHSVDTVRLAETLQRRAEASDVQVPILLEVNVAGEASKDGFAPDALLAALTAVSGLSRLTVRGLMTIAPIAANHEDVRWVFRALRELREQAAAAFPSLGLDHLSMGMTDDFEVAIEEGATLVRVGRALFGERTQYELPSPNNL